MAATLTQVYLRSGTTVRTCWVDRKVRTGDRLTLKAEPGRWWDVLDAYCSQDSSSINRGWNNNI
jgi:hypothetical protein